MTAEEYRALLDVDFNNVKIEDLTDIRKIKIDKNQPQSKRQAQAGNQRLAADGPARTQRQGTGQGHGHLRDQWLCRCSSRIGSSSGWANR